MLNNKGKVNTPPHLINSLVTPIEGGAVPTSGQQQPSNADLQAQWAEYYRQMGYYQQQQALPTGGSGHQQQAPPSDQKVWDW